jgi:hypothetical protein
MFVSFLHDDLLEDRGEGGGEVGILVRSARSKGALPGWFVIPGVVVLRRRGASTFGLRGQLVYSGLSDLHIRLLVYVMLCYGTLINSHCPRNFQWSAD